MAQEYREFSEKTVDDAITAACRALSVTSDKLDYVVVDNGSGGFLGFNARNAVIRARVKEEDFSAAEFIGDVLKDEAIASGEAEPEEAKEKKPGRQRRNVKVSEKAKKAEAAEVAEAPAAEPVAEAAPAEAEKAEKKSAKSHRKPEKPLTAEQVADVKEKADTFLHQVFQAMGMDVEIDMDFDEKENILTTRFTGDDMGVLIGKRGQTLDSLQYLVSLVVNKKLDSYVHVKADTENYRERRRKTLENLAKNIAMKVKRTRREVSLEPMNPYERRIIHSALQGDKYVTTYSEGEDPFRKVVVTPKKQDR